MYLKTTGKMPIIKGIMDEIIKIRKKYDADQENAYNVERERLKKIPTRIMKAITFSYVWYTPQYEKEIKTIRKKAELEFQPHLDRMKELIPIEIKQDLNPGSLVIGIGIDYSSKDATYFVGKFSTKLDAEIERGSVVPTNPMVDGISRNLGNLNLSVGDLTIAVHEQREDPTFKISVKHGIKIDEKILEEAKNLLFV